MKRYNLKIFIIVKINNLVGNERYYFIKLKFLNGQNLARNITLLTFKSHVCSLKT